MKRLGFVFCIFWVLQVHGAVISLDTAVTQAQKWMEGHPIMGQAAERSIASTNEFPGQSDYSVYVISLEPSGYLVLNSDDRFPLVAFYSADSLVDLSDLPENAFLSMLEAYVVQRVEELKTPVKRSADSKDASGVTELYGPFLEVSWDQCNPYNKRCPYNPEAGTGYGQNAATGCVPTSFAQVLHFHRWPFFGEGSHTYTDNEETLIGTHSADFSDPYDWSSMISSYDPWNPNPFAAEEAVSELMYELGVACEANYKTTGTGASVMVLANELENYFFFEPDQYKTSKSTLMAPMEADLRDGFPCVVSISGHSIVADGLMVENGTTTYHFNYGWGGENDGWASADALVRGSTSLRPQLIAFPRTNAVSALLAEPVEVQWILPKRRESEVSKLVIYKEQSNGEWTVFAEDTALLSRRYSSVETKIDDANDFSEFEITSTGTILSGDWSISTTSGVSSCFYKPSPEYTGHLFNLTSVTSITPTASTKLVLHTKYKLSNDQFRILVSTDRSSFTEVWSGGGIFWWHDLSVDLSAYAGQSIYLRLEYEGGSSYVGGGIWIDSISTLEETLPELKGQPIYYTVIVDPLPGTHTLAAVLVDGDLVEHERAPTFTLVVPDDGDGMPSEWERQYGFDPTLNDGDLDPDLDGHNNWKEYLCGTIPTNGASYWDLEAGPGHLPKFYALEERIYLLEYKTSLQQDTWIPLRDIPGSNGVIFVDDYDDEPYSNCFYRVQVRLQDSE